MTGIIAGSGLYEIEGLTIKESLEIDTPYGMPSGPVMICEYGGRAANFLPRHGKDHSIPPHRVNYRANIWALKSVGVRRIISVSAAGGINRDLSPGDIVIGDQIMDFTKNRINTFFDESDVVHVDFTYPFCDQMRKIIIDRAGEIHIGVVREGTYIAVEGPRLETASEIEHYRSAGADIVGMTGMPEAVLAREAEICYAGIYVVTNYAAGMKEGKLTTEEVIATMKGSAEKIRELIAHLVEPLSAKRTCACKDALKDARL
jgi:5'-methylthioadenosine phosphorylase